MRFLILFLWMISQLPANPFALQFPAKEKLTKEDYLEVQKQLRSLNLTPLLQELYTPNKGYTDFGNFEFRCSRGSRQVIIDSENGLYPVRYLQKIGQGSDQCIVCCAPFAVNEGAQVNKSRAENIKTIAAALQSTGFNGYFYYQIGGFPNPTGKEIQYAGVPYSFKIFMMLEAHKLGFNKVLWIDSALLPLRNPVSFFGWIETRGYFLRGWKTPSNAWGFIFPQTRQLLQELTGTDVLNSFWIDTTIFGLKMDNPLVQKLIEEYYRMADLGTPFLSCFPEIFVLSALLGKPEFSSFQPLNAEIFLKKNEPASDMKKLINEGYFFYQRAQ